MSKKEKESPAISPAGAQWAAGADGMLACQLLLLHHFLPAQPAV